MHCTLDSMCMWHVACGRPRRPAVPSVGGHCDCGALTEQLGARADALGAAAHEPGVVQCNLGLGVGLGCSRSTTRRLPSSASRRQPLPSINQSRSSITATRLRSMETKRKPLRRSFLPVLPPSGGTGSQCRYLSLLMDGALGVCATCLPRSTVTFDSWQRTRLASEHCSILH